MKILRVGDPHVRPGSIPEDAKLLEFILSIAKAYKVDRVELLGDLFHTHSVLRLEVVEFWNQWLETLSDSVQTVAIVGNHDQTGDYHSRTHALEVFKRIQNLIIIDEPVLIGSIGYMPYVHDNAKFVTAALKLVERGAKLLVCHQTFNGAKFESGIYAPDGVDPSLIPVPIISGHIHAQQRFANVIYPGTAKWSTASDANEFKGIWIYEHDENMKIQNETFLTTVNVVTPIVGMTWTEGEAEPEIPENARVSIELIGTSAWVSQQKAILKGKAQISSKITDAIKQSDRQAGNSLEEFVTKLFVTNMDRQALLKYMKELDLV